MRLSHFIGNVLKSHRFFWVVFVFFVLESAWIALSAVYPQAFDENFHFGLIKVYSHYWTPFLTHQPPDANTYGAVTRDPSYMYHYLMSFPYRVVAAMTSSQAAQVIVLRFINIGLATAALIVFRRLLIRARLSAAMTHLILLLYALIPIVPQLAGQINYDNLLLPLIAWTLLLSVNVIDELRQRHVPLARLMLLVSICLLATLVKYEFMPIFAAITLFLAITALQQFKGEPDLFGSQLKTSWHQLSRRQRWLLGALLVVGIGLFAQRDGVNIVLFHSFAPDCSRTLDLDSCSSYSPWNYSYQQHQIVQAQGDNAVFMNPLTFSVSWAYWLWYRLFFAVNGLNSGYVNYPPLLLPAAAASLIVLGGVSLLFTRWRQVIQYNPYSIFFSLVVVAYLASLWLEGFSQYHYTQVLQIMNGRYLLPIVPLLAALISLAIAAALRQKVIAKGLLAGLAALCFLQGGGVTTFILRSDASWDWPNSAVINTNNTARSACHRRTQRLQN